MADARSPVPRVQDDSCRCGGTALRGAGNGNFGIVTSLTYKASPLNNVAYVQATWDGLKDLHGVSEAWQRTGPTTDNRLGTQVEIHPNQILLLGVLAGGSAAEAKKLLEPILSVGKPKVEVQVGGWGEIYSGFQIPITEEPANWKFFSQFTKKPFPKKAISLIDSFMREAPTDESNFYFSVRAVFPNGVSKYVATIPAEVATC